jgi:SM-20-related protein
MARRFWFCEAEFVINPELELEKYAARFQRDRFVVIDDFLLPDNANVLAAKSAEVPFYLAYRNAQGEQKLQLPDAGYESVLAGASQHARDHFGYAYDSYFLIEAYKQNTLDPILARFVEIVNSPNYIALMRALTGIASVQRVDAQMTRYHSQHFLRRHNDVHAREARLAAYVLNLSQDWRADQGGILHLENDDGEIIHSVVPRFNRLILFAVPFWHHVSMVAPFAKGERLAITGWLRDLGEI